MESSIILMLLMYSTFLLFLQGEDRGQFTAKADALWRIIHFVSDISQPFAICYPLQSTGTVS